MSYVIKRDTGNSSLSASLIPPRCALSGLKLSDISDCCGSENLVPPKLVHGIWGHRTILEIDARCCAIYKSCNCNKL